MSRATTHAGIAKCGRTSAALLVEEAVRLIAAGADGEWLPSALAAFSRRRPLHVVESRGFPWIEIDSPEDYWRACSDMVGAIDALGESRLASAAARAAAFHSRRTAHYV